jgi:hypothetical protein
MIPRLFVAALLAAPMAAQAADPPLSPPPAEAKPDLQSDMLRFIWESEVQIIEIEVRDAQPPRTEPGDCVVTGVVEGVWRGDAYSPGDHVTLKVPCNSTPRLQRGDKYDSTSGAVDLRTVMQATRACVHIRRSGQLFWGGGDGRRSGPCSSTTGYTPLDPRVLRLHPSEAL